MGSEGGRSNPRAQVFDQKERGPGLPMLTRLLIALYRNVEDSSFSGERLQAIHLGNAIQAKFPYVARERAKEISVSSTALLELFSHQKSEITTIKNYLGKCRILKCY